MIYLILFVLAIGLIEMALSSQWAKIYFTFGIPVFRYQTTYTKGTRSDINARLLEESIPSGKYMPIKVYAYSGTLFGFREALSQGGLGTFTYTPVMRGNLEILTDGKIYVTGYANWFTVFFSLLFISTSLTMTNDHLFKFLFPAFLLVLLGWIYTTQRKRFKGVAESAALLINSYEG